MLEKGRTRWKRICGRNLEGEKEKISFVDLIKFEFSIIMFGGVTRGEIETKRLCWKDEVGQRGTDVGKASEI